MRRGPVQFLLVDDLETNLLALEALLNRDGLELLKARSGREALELLLVHDVALALVDVQMPEMDGFELAELMRGTERTHRVPIIFVTAGLRDPRRRFRGYELGAVDFLFKPIDPHILKSKAEVFFELAQQRNELKAAADENARLLSERSASLHEKEVLLREIHHRVKNNLQIVTSLVSLQADELPDPRLREIFRDVRDRVRSMALVHEKLYQSENLAQVDFAEYTRSLLHSLWRAHGAAAEQVGLRLELEPVMLTIDIAVPCGLLLNELATNALKHAFPQGAAGEIEVRLQAGSDECLSLRVRDNGVGLPAGLDWRESRSLGLQLVRMLAGQLNARIDVKSEKGTTFEVEVPAPKDGFESG